MENWKPLTWISDDYEISDLGRVRSWVSRGPHGRERRRLVPSYLSGHHKGAYLYVRLVGDGVGRDYPVSRLVLLAFVGSPPQPQDEAAHLDGVPDHNWLTNLQWKDRIGNLRDRQYVGNRFGTYPARRKKV